MINQQYVVNMVLDNLPVVNVFNYNLEKEVRAQP